MKTKLIKKGEEEFDRSLDYLENHYFHNGGEPDAEIIVSWNKQEAKEDGWISFYGTNSSITNAIRRCRPGIIAVRYSSAGAELFFDIKYVRPFHTVLKVNR